MIRQVIIGLMTEGTTDQRFLKSVVERTFNEIKFECPVDIDIYDVVEVYCSKGGSFVEKVLEAAHIGHNSNGIMVLCVQADADGKNLDDTYLNKINPAFEALLEKEGDLCKNLVAIVPIQETESWMLADKALLKTEIGTNLTDEELGLNRTPESVANPKEMVANAIRTARLEFTKRRRRDLTIADLYLPIGQMIELNKLATLPSYQDFQKNVRNSFERLNLLNINK